MFEPGDHDELARCIVDVVEQPTAAAALTHAARELLTDRYSWDAIAAQTLDVYRAALRRPS
jgi:glycosyltransferase involved in cell wall biosynthesis